MKLNTKKSKVMDICFLTNRPLLPAITMNGEVVKQVETFKLLGMTISDCLKLSNHVDAIVGKASKRLYFVRVLSK